jgi:hypothetical protein
MPTSRWSAHVVALGAASATVITGIVLVGGPASAATGTTFFDTPGSYTWTVPQDVTSLHVDTVAGSGAAGNAGPGGAAAHIVADIPVTPGDTLYLHVGGNAVGVTGGANGGGSTTSGTYAGGGGGGASDIRQGGDSLADRVLVAAGSGGGSGWGGSGGNAGQPGGGTCGAAAQPGTSTSGGSPGGAGCVGYGSTWGALGTGGNGGSYPPAVYGGAGGAGFYGGGGGGPFDGGAGGSNLIPTDATNVATSLGTAGQAPYIHLSYSVADPAAYQVSVSTIDSSIPANGASTTAVTAVVVDQYGNALPGDTVDFSSTDPGIDFGPVTDNGDGSYTATVTSSTTAGSPTITATDTSNTPVGASTTLTLTPLSQALAFTSGTPTSPVVGEQYAPTADGGGSGRPVTFSVDPSTSGYGSGSAACSYSAPAFSFDHHGICVIDADQAGNAQYSAAPTAQQVVAIGQAATATAVSVGPSDVTATVTPVAPGAGTPSGTVTFSVAGSPVGTSTLVGSVAHLGNGVPSGQTQEVTAVYDGDADFTGSSGSTSRQDPTLTARVTSSSTRTAYGWYRSPVTVSFTCTRAAAALTDSCPAPVTLDASAPGQSVTRTVMATDGGAASATVSGINIDMAAPRASISGVRNGARYRGSAPTAHCVGADDLSGVIGCRLTRRTSGALTRYTATVTDRAGNVSRSSVSYRVLNTYVAGAPYRRGAFDVRAGRSYRLVATTVGKRAPRYYSAATIGRRPSPAGPLFHRAGTSHGRHVWTIVVRLPSGMAAHSNWVLGVKAGKSMRMVHIHF